MSVSVVIPTKDRLSSLQRVLPTYLSQPETAEVIVVVDGSTDGTAEYLESLSMRDSRVRYVDNGVNRGIPFAKNAGISTARCEFVFIGEDDVELTPGFLRTLLDHRETSDADIIAGRNIWRYESETAEEAISRTNAFRGPAVDTKRILIEMGFLIEDDAQQLLISSPMLAPTAIFREVRFDERYRENFWREETDMQISAQEAGYKLVSCPHAVCFNYMIRNDRGGVYSSLGVKRLLWITINNWRFVKKHGEFLERNFHVHNHTAYVAMTSAYVLWKELLLPRAVGTKRRLLGPPASRSSHPGHAERS